MKQAPGSRCRQGDLWRCYSCSDYKYISEFYVQKKRCGKGTSGIPSSWCKVCNLRNAKLRYNRRVGRAPPKVGTTLKGARY